MPSHTKAERKKRNKSVSKAKAKEILSDGKIRGKKLTRPQQKFFGAKSR